MRSAAWSAALGTGALLALAARAYGRRRRAARDAAGPPPRHVAIIMDGNRRFGARAFGPERRLEGHAAGARKLGEVVDWCLGRGVAELTVFAFSTENWDRDAGEVAALMREFVARAAEVERRCVERGIRCRILCTAPERLPRAARAALCSQSLPKRTLTTACDSSATSIAYSASPKASRSTSVCWATRTSASSLKPTLSG